MAVKRELTTQLSNWTQQRLRSLCWARQRLRSLCWARQQLRSLCCTPTRRTSMEVKRELTTQLSWLPAIRLGIHHNRAQVQHSHSLYQGIVTALFVSTQHCILLAAKK